MRGVRPRWVTAVGLVLGGLVFGTTLLPVLARADDTDSSDKQISVVVIATTPQPSGSASVTATASPTPTRSRTPSASTSATTPTTAPTPGTNPPTSQPSASASPSVAPGNDEVSIGGILYVSGLRWSYRFSPNPFDGSLDLSFTVRNEYSEPVDGTATFWLTNIFGGPVDTPVTVDVLKIQPAERRVVTATIGGVAQWTFLTAHATFIPPERLGGIPLIAVTRQGSVFVLPWAVLAAAALVGGWFGYRRYRERPPSHPPASSAAQSGDEA